MNLTFRRSKTSSWQEFDSKIVVITPKTQGVHELNSTAAWLWKNLDGEKNINQLTEKMFEFFDADEKTLKSDITMTLVQMKKTGLVDAVQK